MLTLKLFAFCVLICLAQSQAPAITIEQALQSGKELERTVQAKIDDALPPNAAAHVAAQEVLATFKSGLETCERQLKVSSQFEAYFKCSGDNMAWAMASIGELAGKHWSATSGAARLGLFW